MKAIEIIEAMCYDSALAEKAQVVKYDGLLSVSQWTADYFGAKIVTSDYGDAIKDGDKFLCVYDVDMEDVFPFSKNAPDFILERYNPQDYPEDDSKINLWRIEP